MSLNVLVTSDFHADEELKQGAIEEVENNDYDLFVNLGDYMDEEYAEDLFDSIGIPALGTVGNRDLHFSQELTDGETPVYNFLEADIDEEYLLILIGAEYPDDIKDQVGDIIEEHGDRSKVLVGTHYPPKKLGDRIHSGDRVGFENFREIILKHKPALWASGHIHEDFGQDSLFSTTFLNAASEESGKGFSVVVGEEGVESVEQVSLRSSD